MIVLHKSFGDVPSVAAPAVDANELAVTMLLRGAAGALAGAAAGPRGREGIWGVAGFVAGATAGEVGIVGILMAALWKKADK